MEWKCSRPDCAFVVCVAGACGYQATKPEDEKPEAEKKAPRVGED